MFLLLVACLLCFDLQTVIRQQKRDLLIQMFDSTNHMVVAPLDFNVVRAGEGVHTLDQIGDMAGEDRGRVTDRLAKKQLVVVFHEEKVQKSLMQKQQVMLHR
jgi:hypothetical protein